MKKIKKAFDSRIMLALVVVGLVAVLAIVGNRLQQSRPVVLPPGTPGLSLYTTLDDAHRLLREDKPRDAATVLEGFIAAASDPVEQYQASLLLAEAYVSYGDFNKGLSAYQDLEKFNQPESLAAILATAQVAEALREYTVAETYYKQADALLPEDNFDEYKQFIESGITRVVDARTKLQFSEPAMAATARAEVAEKLGDKEAAIKYYEQAIASIDTSKPEGLGYQRYLSKALNKLKGVS